MFLLKNITSRLDALKTPLILGFPPLARIFYIAMPRAKKAKNEEPKPIEEVDDEDDDDDSSSSEEEEVEKEEEEEEQEEDEVNEEDNAKRLKRLKRSRINERRKARQNGHRHFAKIAGADVGKQSFGNDITTSIFSAADIRRMAQWAPSSGDVFMPNNTFETNLTLRDESISSGPLKVLGVATESFARKVVSELVLRNIESGGAQTISAANVKAVLRPFVGALHCDDFLTPGGVVRIAQQIPTGKFEVDDHGNRVWKTGDSFLHTSNEEDHEAAIAEERKNCKATNSKMLKEADKAKEAKTALRKAKRAAAKASEPLAAVTASA